MVNKWFRVWLVVGAAITLAAVPYLLFWDRLPDPMASHWGPGSEVDGSMPRWAGLVTTAVLIILVGGGLSVMLARQSEGRREPSPESLALTSFIGALAMGLSWVSIFLNLDAGSWGDAASMPWWVVLVVGGGALACGFIGYRVGQTVFPIATAPQPRPPLTAVLPGENAAWVGTASSPGQLLAIVPGVVALTVIPSPYRWLGVLLIVLGVLLSRVVARVGPGGLTVLLGGFLPVKRIPVERIASAVADYIEPAKWGGWGYRLVPDASAVVIRAGDGIIVTLNSGRRFAVTVDDAVTGAGLLNGLVGRIRSA
jgi:uncharacterized membrane protein